MFHRIPSLETIRRNPRRFPDIVLQSLATARELSSLGAFITLLDERALRQAQHVADRLSRGEKLPLGGYVTAVKDNIAVKNEPLTCGSRILDLHSATFSATVVERLEAAGAVVLGKTNLDEFAMGSSTENSGFFPALNPFDPERVPGGSSGGSAVAVAAGLCHASLGSETGGSVRQPAALCGVCGLKPTYGRVSRYGLVAFGSSLDQVSPFARTCAELYDVLLAIGGGDARDATSSNKPLPQSPSLRRLDRPLRIGIIREFLENNALDESVANAAFSAVRVFKQAGHECIDVHLPSLNYAIPVYYIVATAEASSNLARFDGVRYGYRSPAATDLATVYDASRGDGFGKEVRRRIMMGTYVLSSGYYDAYYKAALRVRRLITDELLAALNGIDVLFTPTTPSTAFKLGEKVDDPIAMYLSDVFTVPANLAGIPSVSVPWGVDSRGLPIGMQLMAGHFEEELLLQAGAEIERLRPAAA